MTKTEYQLLEYLLKAALYELNKIFYQEFLTTAVKKDYKFFRKKMSLKNSKKLQLQMPKM